MTMVSFMAKLTTVSNCLNWWGNM